MPTSAFTFFESFIANVVDHSIDLENDQFTLFLTNTAPTSATDTQLSDITEITYTNLSSRNLTTSSASATSGDYSVVFADINLAASGGDVGPFRYVGIYSETSTGDLLVGYYDYGSSTSILDGEDMDVDLPAGGVITLNAA